MTDAPPELLTERLRLRAWRDDDLDAFAELCADPEVMRWHGANGETKTREQSAEQLAGFRAQWDVRGFGLWCAADPATDECMGFVGLAVPTFLPEVMPTVEVGWRLARKWWGQGFATEGGRRSVEFAFDTLGLDRIVSITRPENRNSWNVMEKLGMTLERTTNHPEYGFPVVVYELSAP
jgi:RimJ/RimL family protein N-acetyltransferase